MGAPGATGNTGATGPAGTNGLAQYAYIYNTSAETVAIGSNVTFASNGPMTAGIIHTAGANITIGESGVYDITYSVSGVEPNQMALLLNGVLVPGTIYGAGAGTAQNTGHAIITATSQDVLTLNNDRSAAAVTLQTLAGGTQPNTNASIVIEKIGGTP